MEGNHLESYFRSQFESWWLRGRWEQGRWREGRNCIRAGALRALTADPRSDLWPKTNRLLVEQEACQQLLSWVQRVQLLPYPHLTFRQKERKQGRWQVADNSRSGASPQATEIVLPGAPRHSLPILRLADKHHPCSSPRPPTHSQQICHRRGENREEKFALDIAFLTHFQQLTISLKQEKIQ